MSGITKMHSVPSVVTLDTSRFDILMYLTKSTANKLQYWDWSKSAAAPQNSSIFNGDAYSMGGNGKYIPGHQGLVLPPPSPGVNPTIYLKPGLGGGCVQTGPFANMTVNLGPIGLPNTTAGPDHGFGYNPRCLKRDVGPYCTEKYCNYTRIHGKTS
jgi:tyrosinase